MAINDITLGDDQPLSNDLKPIKVGGEASILNVSSPKPDGSDNGLFKVNGDLDITGTLKTKLSHDLIYDFDDEVNTLAQAKIDALIDSAPAALDTLNELAAALNDDASFSTTITNSLALKAPLAAPAFTGDATFDSTTLTIDSSNNRVGIGTASPSTKLHVFGNNGENFRWGYNASVYGRLFAGTAGARIDVTGANSGYGLALSMDNSTKVTLLPDGNVGIGTTSPTEMLHLQGTGDVKILLEADTDNATETDNPEIIFSQDGGLVTGIAALTSNNTFWLANTFDDTTGDLKLGTRNTARITIEGDGNVGIGTTSPSNSLDVYSPTTNVVARFKSGDNQAWINITDDTSGTYGCLLGYDDDDSNLFMVADASVNKKLVIKDSGNVGIGTTSPSEALDVSGTIKSSVSGQAILSLDNTATNGDEWNLISRVRGSTSTLEFRNVDTTTDAVAITSAGNVGIGTTSPSKKLDVNGNIGSNGDIFIPSGNALQLADVTDHTKIERSTGLQFYTNSTARLNILDSGNVGIGTTSPTTTLDVEGTVSYKHTAFSTAGPTDNIDVSDTSVLEVDTSSNNVIIGGFTGGVQGQILYIVKTNTANFIQLEHNEGGGSQDIFITTGSDERVVGYGGYTLYCNGTSWFSLSNPTGGADAG